MKPCLVRSKLWLCKDNKNFWQLSLFFLFSGTLPSMRQLMSHYINEDVLPCCISWLLLEARFFCLVSKRSFFPVTFLLLSCCFPDQFHFFICINFSQWDSSPQSSRNSDPVKIWSQCSSHQQSLSSLLLSSYPLFVLASLFAFFLSFCLSILSILPLCKKH